DDAEWEKYSQEWARILKHRSYLKLDGRPVFKIHGLDYFLRQNGGDPTRVARRIVNFRAVCKDAGAGDPIISAGVMPGGVPPVANVQPYDFLTTYMDVPNVPMREKPYPYTVLLAQAEEGWKRYAQHCEIAYVPYLGAGWDPRPWKDPRPSFDMPTQDKWIWALRSAKKALDIYPKLGIGLKGGKKQKMLLIYAWNEFGEGGIVAPTHGEQYMKLEGIKTVFSDRF
ncbi:MAG: hypothetical protein WCL39_13505, partial [Armatimonadota bacterium]